MKKHLLYIFLLISQRSLAQEYNYVHYDTRDGLAGSSVYRMCQDKKGYMWFATDNGVSMFDGKRFKNFTTEDGLTDNDVLHISTDSRGRVWMMPFTKSVCYYYEGKIYSFKNDTSLRNANFSSWVNLIGENAQGEIYFTTISGVFLFKNNGRLKKIADYEELSAKYGVDKLNFIAYAFNDRYPYGLLLYNNSKVFIEKNEEVVFLKNIVSTPNANYRSNFFRIDENLEVHFPEPDIKVGELTNVAMINSSQWLYNTLNGSILIHKDGRHDPKIFLPGKRISNSMLDSEGNIWFSTIGEGVYCLTSRSMITFSNNNEAFSLAKFNDRIYAGLADGTLWIFKDRNLEREIPYNNVYGGLSSKRLYTMKPAKDEIFLGFDLYLARHKKNNQFITTPLRALKSIDVVDSQFIVIANNISITRFRYDDVSLVDTLLVERGTKVIYDNGLYYIGTLNGLVIVDSNKNITRERDDESLLNKRIVDICKLPDGTFCIATNDNGLVFYKNKRVDTVINTRYGLSSNICKSLFLKDNFLWVGTNKGLNKIDINTRNVVAKYSVSDGLASDVINAIYAEDGTVWVCSPTGVTYFDEKDISYSSICALDLVAIHVADDTTRNNGVLGLTYKNNFISFDYTAISFKSGGDILYKYQLTGLDDDWKETRLTTLAYPSLPPGDYEFKLYAINKYGKQSKTISVPFTIAAPFWKTFWFWVAVSLLLTSIVWYILYARYKRLQHRMKEKNELMQRMTELEQASLRAQMNPHFIFNCLNSIQHFILQGDIKQTNRYIAQFGSLIRQTLDNSARANISIADEINYLTSYLELERMRFSSQFHYEIKVDKAIELDFTHIPSMLLQPFVENAIRHGIRYKQEGVGMLKINISCEGEDILISIEDNGVGREVAARYKSQQHIEYQSKGITLTQKRLDILNTSNADKIKRAIIDLKDEHGAGIGTKILLSFPLSVIEKLN